MFTIPKYQPTIEIKDNKIKLYYGMINFKIKFYLDKYIKKKLKYLFTEVTTQHLEFYKFFALDVYEVLKYILEKQSESKYNTLDLRMVKNLIELLDNEYWIPMSKTKYKLDFDNVKTYLRYEPLEHQKIIFERYENIRSKYGYRGMLLDAAVGSGKSFSSIALSLAFNSSKTIIIAPLQTVDKVWRKTLAGSLTDPEMVFKEKQPVYFSKYDKHYNDEKYLVFHYEDLSKLYKMIPILKQHNLCVIIDESHNFADTKTKRTKLLTEIVDKLDPSNVIPMSGTPIKASVQELNIIFKLIVKGYDKVIENRFIKIYRTPGFLFGEILKEKYSNYVIKVKKTDIKLEPITTIYTKVKLDNGEEYTLESIKEKMKDYYDLKLREYKENFKNYEGRFWDYVNTVKNMNTNIRKSEWSKYESYIKKIVSKTQQNKSVMNPEMLEYVAYCNKFEKENIIPYLDSNNKKIFRDIKSIYKYPKLKVIGEVLAHIVMANRRQCVVDIANVFEYQNVINTTLKKTLIFSSYIEVCDTVFNKVKEIGYEPLSVYGDNSKYLSDTVGKFTSIDKYNPLVTTYKSLSTGVPLIVANHIIAMDVPFRRYIYEQAIGRAWRTGQDKPVNVYIPELDTGDEPNINDRNLDIMKFYVSVVNDITGDDIPEDMLEKNTIKEDSLSTEELSLNLNIEKIKENKNKHINVIDEW